MAEESYRRTNEGMPQEVAPSTAGATSADDLGLWLIADGCRLRIESPHGPLYDLPIHALWSGEIIRWIRAEIALEDDEEPIPAQAFRLIVQKIPMPEES